MLASPGAGLHDPERCPSGERQTAAPLVRVPAIRKPCGPPSSRLTLHRLVTRRTARTVPARRPGIRRRAGARWSYEEYRALRPSWHRPRRSGLGCSRPSRGDHAWRRRRGPGRAAPSANGRRPGSTRRRDAVPRRGRGGSDDVPAPAAVRRVADQGADAGRGREGGLAPRHRRRRWVATASAAREQDDASAHQSGHGATGLPHPPQSRRDGPGWAACRGSRRTPASGPDC